MSLIPCLIVCLITGCVLAPPDFSEFSVDEIAVELPGLGDSLMGTHRLGDTLSFSVKVRDNKGIVNLNATKTPLGGGGVVVIQPFLQYNLSLQPSRSFEFSWKVVLTPDTVANRIDLEIANPPA
ncbi:MAG: hypothetical protein AAFV07_09495, partial [Bacteroidota bacterium]